MRRGRFFPGRALSVAQQHNRLCPVDLCCQTQKPWKIPQAFKTDCNRRCLRVLGEISQKHFCVQHRLISDACPFGNTAVLIAQGGQNGHADAARLADDADAALCNPVWQEGAVERTGRVNQAQRVWPEQYNLMFPAKRRHLLFQCRAYRVRLLETGADHDNMTNSGLCALADAIHHAVAVDGNYCMGHALRQIQDRGITGFSKKPLILRIDTVDRACKAIGDAQNKPASDLSRFFSGADNCDGIRPEKAIRYGLHAASVSLLCLKALESQCISTL